MIEPPNEFVKEFIPIAGKFFEAVKNGVQEYHQKDPNDIIEHRPTTQKSVIRDKIVANITRLMPEISGMKLIKRYGTDVFVLFGKYKLKVHMLKDNKGIALNNTQHCLDFNNNQNVQLSLPIEDFKEQISLYLGYVKNDKNLLNPQVFLVCPS